MDYIREYTSSTNDTAQEAFAFILANRRNVPKQLLKEMMLNYRTYFKTEQKDRIVNDYQTIVIGKQQQHKSDMAIGYNIVKYVQVNKDLEQVVVDYLYSRVQEHIDATVAKVYFLKKKLVLEYIEKNILIKRRA